MRFFIVILIILLLPLIFPYIWRWVRSYIMGKMEDRMRRMMGMPTRSEEKKARKEQQKAERREEKRESPRYSFRGKTRNHNVGNPAESIRMLRFYAEDVEYVEIREYSAEIHFAQDADSGKMKIKYEEQVSDAEFVIIR